MYSHIYITCYQRQNPSIIANASVQYGFFIMAVVKKRTNDIFTKKIPYSQFSCPRDLKRYFI